MGKKKEGKPFCTRCGRRMKRIVRSGAEPALLFHCPKCGATLPRHGEDWRRRDILFVLLNEGGAHVPSKFEKNGPPMCPNQPRV